MHSIRKLILPIRGLTGQRGFTLVEVMVASTISIFVIGGILSIWYLTARSVYDLYGPTHARSWRQRSINQIRLRLCDAKIGSCVISDDGHRLRYTDPTLDGSPTSEFYFTTATAETVLENKGTLFYDEDISKLPPARRVAEGPINIIFAKGDPEGNGLEAMVTLWVRTAESLSYGDVDDRDGETVVYLRNP